MNRTYLTRFIEPVIATDYTITDYITQRKTPPTTLQESEIIRLKLTQKTKTEDLKHKINLKLQVTKTPYKGEHKI